MIQGTVRDTVLRWTLDLEADGIKGEGMSFSPQEKQIAASKADDLQRQVSILIAGSINNSAIQQHSADARQDFT
jgi:hypothetical protein